ncbi:MAG: TetR/AcrR family transcriptional regulator [Pseudomonadota bacterium]
MNTSNAFYISENDSPSKKEILKSALKLFTRYGVVGTTIRAIASDAGYTNPVLFKYFDSKDALALYIFEQCYLQCLSVLKGALDKHDTYLFKLREVVGEFAKLISTQPEAFFFMQENLREFWSKISESTRKHSILAEFRKFMQQGRDEGVVNSTISIDIQLAALTGFFFQLARMHYFQEINLGITARIDEIEAMIIQMFRP